ncbi:DUF998 domain-containing protein [Candidatus Margulisiibacteriota bacterium]
MLNRPKSRILILFGALSPIMYIAAAVIGGTLAPGYDHVRDSVSDLLRPGAPNKALLDSLMLLSNVFTILGSIGILLVHKAINKLARTGIFLILATGILSILSASVFRLPTGPEMTVSGVIHIAIVAALVLTSLALILMIGSGMSRYEGWKYFKLYSIITFLLFFIGGGLSPVIIAKGIPVVGLVEKLSVCVYFQWIIVLFIKFYKYK